MATFTNNAVAKEILDYLKVKLEIPENVIGLTLRLRRNELIKIDCEYFPDAVEVANPVKQTQPDCRYKS